MVEDRPGDGVTFSLLGACVRQPRHEQHSTMCRGMFAAPGTGVNGFKLCSCFEVVCRNFSYWPLTARWHAPGGRRRSQSSLLLHFPAQNWICGVFSLQNVQYLAPRSISQAPKLSRRRYRDDLNYLSRRHAAGSASNQPKKSLLGHFQPKVAVCGSS